MLPHKRVLLFALLILIVACDGDGTPSSTSVGGEPDYLLRTIPDPGEQDSQSIGGSMTEGNDSPSSGTNVSGTPVAGRSSANLDETTVAGMETEPAGTMSYDKPGGTIAGHPDAVHAEAGMSASAGSPPLMGGQSNGQNPCIDGASLIVNEVLFDPPPGAAGDANGDGMRDAKQDEFIELVNGSAEPLDISGFRIYDATGLRLGLIRHTIELETILPPWSALVVFGGSVPQGQFGDAVIQVANSDPPDLSLNNGRDTLTITDANGCIVTTMSYGEGIDGTNVSDQSTTRQPDVNGLWRAHRTASQTDERYSPGTRADGVPFGQSPDQGGQTSSSAGTMAGGASAGTPVAGEPSTGGVIAGQPSRPGRCFEETPIVINEVLFDPAPGPQGDANGDGIRHAKHDEFIELVNASARAFDASALRVYDATGLRDGFVRHTIAPNTIMEPWSALIIFGGANPVGQFGGAEIQVANGDPPELSLNNERDTITVTDAEGCVITTMSYGQDFDGTIVDDESTTRSPDIFGDWRAHQDASPMDARYSPGTRSSGAPFGEPANAGGAAAGGIDGDRAGAQSGGTTDGIDGERAGTQSGGMPVSGEDGGAPNAGSVAGRPDGQDGGLKSGGQPSGGWPIDDPAVTGGDPAGTAAPGGRRAPPHMDLHAGQIAGGSMNAGGEDHDEPGGHAGGHAQNGQCPADVSLVINEVLYDPGPDLTGDANGDGRRDAKHDEFIELVNDSDIAIELSGYQIFDATALESGEPRHIIHAGTTVQPGAALIIFGGGQPRGDFGGAQIQVIDEDNGDLSLDNDRDTITITDMAGCVVTTMTYGPEEAGSSVSNESTTRAPDIEGPWHPHRQASIAATYFSPGRRNDGTPFADRGPVGGVPAAGGSAGGAQAGGASAVCPDSSPLIINEVLYDPPMGLTGDANRDGIVDGNGDEFIEFVNTSERPFDASGYKIYDSFSQTQNEPRHTVLDGTIIPANGALVVFGAPARGRFGDALVQAANGLGGALQINNDGDELTVRDPNGCIILTFDHQRLGIDMLVSDESVTRSPDLGVEWRPHSSAANGDGLFSPGTTIDGMPFGR